MSLGNESADILAKWAFHQKVDPLPLTGEERFTLILDGNEVLDDGLCTLRKKCRELALVKWKALKTQGRLARLDSAGLMNQSRRILQLAHDYGDVFAACNWVPTNYRKWRAAQTIDRFCSLCLGNVSETFQHLFVCPALRNEQEDLKGVGLHFLTLAELGMVCDPQEDHIRKTVLFIRNSVPRPGTDRLALTDRKLRELIRAFVETNHGRQGLSRRRCLFQIQRILSQRACACPRNQSHHCSLKNCWQTPADFMMVLKEAFALNVDGMADALHRTSVFRKWCSEFADDVVFGASHDFFQSNLQGENIFINPPFNAMHGIDILCKVIDRCATLVNTDLPTRCLLIIPVFQGTHGDRFLRRALAKNAISVMHFSSNSFSFEPPDDYYLESPRAAVFYHEMSLVLFCSRKSLVVDPLDWTSCVQKLSQWAKLRNISVKFPLDSPLGLVVPPCLRPRASYGETHYSPLLAYLPWMEDGRINKFGPLGVSKTHQRIACQALMKVDPVLASLGVFPPCAARLYSDGSDEKARGMLNQWSLATFWNTFKLWKKRSQLVWKQKLIFEKLEHSDCMSAFHFFRPAASNPYICQCPREVISVTPPEEAKSVSLAAFIGKPSTLKPGALDDLPDELKEPIQKTTLRRSERLKRKSGISVPPPKKPRRKRRSAVDFEKKVTARRKRRKKSFSG